MRFQNAFLAGNQVVGIVFHEGSTLRIRRSSRHDLHQAHHGRRLPVAFSAKAVALLHQSLDCQSGKLLQAAQHTEMGNDGLIIAVLQELLKADLDSCLLYTSICRITDRLLHHEVYVKNDVDVYKRQDLRR